MPKTERTDAKSLVASYLLGCFSAGAAGTQGHSPTGAEAIDGPVRLAGSLKQWPNLVFSHSFPLYSAFYRLKIWIFLISIL